MKMKIRRIFRYCGLGVAILFFLWIAALAAVYFFVDVNKIKGAALTYVNENTRGELSVGDVKLKLFPVVHFEVKDVVLKSSTDFQRRELFKCTKAKLSFGIISLIFGKPNIELYLDQPYVDFIAREKELNNVSDLMIKKEAVKGQTQQADGAAVEKKKDSLSYLFISRFTFDVNNAELKYTSQKAKYDVKSLSFRLMIDPADKSIELKAGSPLDIKEKTYTLSGEWKTTIEVKPRRDDNFDVSAMLDATKLAYDSKSFVKPKGVPFKVELTAAGNETLLTIKKAVVTIVKPWLTITGKVSGLKEDSSPIALNIEAAPLDSSLLKKMLTALKDNELSGNINSKFSVSGTIQKLLLDAELDATSVGITGKSFNKASGEALKAKLVLTKTKDSIDIQTLKLWLKQGVAEGTCKITNLESPTFKLDIKYSDPSTKNDLAAKISNSMNDVNSFTIDAYSQFLDLNSFVQTDKRSTSGKGGSKASSAEAATAAQPMDKKKELVTKEQMKSLNELLSKYSVVMNVKADKVLYKDFAFNDLVFQANASKGNLVVNRFKADTFGGTLSSGLNLSTNIAKPSYNASFDASNIKVKDAVTILMPDLKGIIDGVISGKIAVSASGYTVGEVQKSLTGNGNFAFNNFVYSSKELNEAISQKLGEKLGGLAAAQSKNIFGGNPGWETVQGSFNIKDERINIDKLMAKEKEYMAEGSGHIEFNKYMDMDFMVTVPYRSIPYEPFKVDKKDLSMLPIHLTGPAAKPKFDTAKLVQYFLDKTVEFEKKKLRERADQELQKVKSQATDRLKQAIKGFKF